MNRSLIFLFRLGLVVASLAILYLATTPKDLRVLTHFYDKANHLAAFACLALLLDFSFPSTPFGRWKIITLLAYGILIECLQSFVPSRHFSLLDFVADGVGILVYCGVRPLLKALPVLRRRWQTTTGSI
ncbi:MAG: VanZ family protein [Verrucomicrobiota bacterium]